ncbi:hypothetical protein PMAYCL1PPCAC_30357 [Pristionchus mayeri]|uniref:Uncharacterized protein n=1 Tax=Pristionchus mayeri TaxID=1317129 RepID=A0AAN5IBM8_9BILA|nr:hypothetical protein PMAYCL1PPCAC_30357 [Pristionchus mayeri]
MVDHLPLMTDDGDINPQLMAYSRLFQLEIEQVLDQHTSMNLQYLTSLNANGVDYKKFWDWFVREILSNEETFRILHEEIKNKNTVLYSELHMEGATDEATVKTYK